MYRFFNPPAPPAIYACPSHQPRIETLLPAAINDLLKVVPSALIGGKFAKNLAYYYRGLYHADVLLNFPAPKSPTVSMGHHFHIVIVDDPIFRFIEPISPARTRIILGDLQRLTAGTGSLIETPHYLQIQNASYQGYYFNITIGNPAFADFVFVDQPFLINTRHHCILFNNKLTADNLFELRDDEIQALSTLPQEPIQTDEEEYYDAPTSDDVIKEEEDEDEFFDALETESNVNVAAVKEPEAKLKKKKHKSKSTTTENKSNEIKLEIGNEQPIEMIPIFSRQYWSTLYKYMMPSSTTKRTRHHHYRPPKAYHATAVTMPIMVNSPLFQFLKRQLRDTRQFSTDPTEWLNDHRDIIAPQLSDSAEFNKAFSEFIQYSKVNIYNIIRNQYHEVNETFEILNKLNTVSYFAIPYSMVITSRAYNPETRTFNVIFPLLAYGGIICINILKYGQKAMKVKYEKELHIRSLKAHSKLLNATETTKLALNLLTLMELKSNNIDLREILNIEHKESQFQYNFINLIYSKTDAKKQADIVVDTLICLVCIHGPQLFEMIRNNNVPEINIPYMSLSEQECLFADNITKLQAFLPAPEQYRNARWDDETRTEVRNIMDTILLIYTLRGKSEASEFFTQFEQNNKDIIDYLQYDEASIHQYAPKSTLFTCMMADKPNLALGLLERMVQTPGPSRAPRIK